MELTIGEWAFLLTVPVLTLLFIHAAYKTIKTHREINFDSALLLCCIVINLVACYLEFYCTQTLSLLNLMFQSMMMVYILFRVSRLLGGS